MCEALEYSADGVCLGLCTAALESGAFSLVTLCRDEKLDQNLALNCCLLSRTTKKHLQLTGTDLNV